MTTKFIITFVDHPSEWNTTTKVIPLKKVTETSIPLISYSISPINDLKKARIVTNRTDSTYTIRKTRRLPKFTKASPEQSKFIEPIDTAILNSLPEGEAYLTTYFYELLRTKNRTTKEKILVPTAKNIQKTVDHSPIQSQIHTKLNKMKVKLKKQQTKNN